MVVVIAKGKVHQFHCQAKKNVAVGRKWPTPKHMEITDITSSQLSLSNRSFNLFYLVFVFEICRDFQWSFRFPHMNMIHSE